MEFVNAQSFEDWRGKARRLLAGDFKPWDVQWTDQTFKASLFDSVDLPNSNSELNGDACRTVNVPKAFIDIARTVACHRDVNRWCLLYRMLWRITHGESQLMNILTDDDVCQLNHMAKAVSRDVHKTKAFVRFRKVADQNGVENYIAWHRPDHYVVRLAAPFFARRFKEMNWTILTPDESATWDQHDLTYGPGVPLDQAPQSDELEELWKTYYASIFNPARVKVAMMKREMPVRHWPTLPEASIIDDLLKQAPVRVEAMIKNSEGFEETAAHYLPERHDLDSLRQSASGCKACHLYKHASQTVFGEGISTARIVVVGEQPGDKEDIAGRPFVGPAGKLLDDAFLLAGIDRDEVYITNVVKHFKFVETSTPRGKHRLHKKPDSREIFACRPWLEAELNVIKPVAIMCLGATAAQALIGRDFRITQQRGKVIASEWCNRTIATWHPAAILRMPDSDRRQQMQSELIEDLQLVRTFL